MKNHEVSNDFRDILSSIENMLAATVEESIRRHLQYVLHLVLNIIYPS